MASFADAQRIPLEVGQVWTIKDAPRPETRVVISLIEPYDPELSAVHVSMTGVGFGKSATGQTFVGEISHLPFEREALEASLDKLVGNARDPGPEFRQGYQEWKKAGGGIFTISAAETIRVVFETLQITPIEGNE